MTTIKKIKLVNGPYDGKWVEDTGASPLRVGISTDGKKPGATVGDAFYEPSPDRVIAFWSHNKWIGILDVTTDA